MRKFIKEYIWAIRKSYSFMEGLRDWKFWLRLPFKAWWIAFQTIKYERQIKNEKVNQ